MDVVLRPIGEDELDAFILVPGQAFGDRWSLAGNEAWATLDLDRTVAAVVDGEIVATGRNYSFELTVPGGSRLTAGGVSAIATRPTHRRRGLLSQVMAYLIEESRQRGEAVSILTASEGGIYGRFGYGVAQRMARVAVARASAAMLGAAPPGVMRFVAADDAVALARPLFDRMRTERVGAVSRPDAWWDAEWAPVDRVNPVHRFDVVYEVAGRVDGYVMYRIDGTWEDGISSKAVAVCDFLAASPDAEAALWRYLLDIDLTTEVQAWNTPLDAALPWLLSDSRQYRTLAVRDSLWLRPIDTARLLGSRAYGAHGELVIEITDPLLEVEETLGRFLIRSASDGSTCARTDHDPDLVMTADALGAISLGAFPPSQLARAGRLATRDHDVVRRADAMFRPEREPFPFTWF